MKYKINNSTLPKSPNLVLNSDGFCIGDCETCSIDDCFERPVIEQK